MHMEIETSKGLTLLIEGEVILEDAGFDHAFGYEQRWEARVDDFRVTLYVDIADYDITSSLSKHDVELLKQSLIEEYHGQSHHNY